MKQILKTYSSNGLSTFKLFTKNPLEFLKEHATSAEGISSFNILHYRMVHITDPDMIKKVLIDHADRYTQSRDRDHMKLLFGNGLLTSADEHWRKQRAMIQPAFSKVHLVKLFQKIVSQIAQYPPAENRQIDIHQYSIDLINRIMADAIFSDTSAEKLEIGTLLIDLKGSTLARLSDFDLPLWIPTAGNRNYKAKRKKVYDRINALVQKRKSNDTQYDDILDSMLHAKDKTTGAGMTDAEIVEELLGIYAAAHEPVAIAMTYSLYLIANHPEVGQKINDEIVSLGIKENITIEQYYRLTYTRQVVNETLRLYPSVWISGRRAVNADDLSGYEIRRNDNIIYCPAILHRLPELWPDPDRFDPDRFAEGHTHHAFAFVPFSGGPKYCVGSHLAMMILQCAICGMVPVYDMLTSVQGITSNPFTTFKPADEVTFTLTRKVPATF